MGLAVVSVCRSVVVVVEVVEVECFVPGSYGSRGLVTRQPDRPR